jgi:hypothetical protein
MCLKWLRWKEGTTNLIQHANSSKHKQWYTAECQKSDPAPTNRGKPGVNMFSGADSLAKFNRLLALWIACNYRPISIVKDEFFLQMLRSISSPDLELPSEKTITNQIGVFAQKVLVMIKEELKRQPFVSLTADFWSTLSHLSMVGVTVHWINDLWEMKHRTLCVREVPGSHTGPNNANVLEFVIKEFDLVKKVVGLTMDNAPNMTMAGKILEEDRKLIEIFIGCMCHATQSAGKTAEKEQGEVHTVVTTVKKGVTYLHQSNQSLAQFKVFQESAGEPGPIPAQAIDIRWNSICKMFEGLIKTRNTYDLTVQWAKNVNKKKDAAEITLDGMHWSIMEGITPSLVALRHCCDFLQGSNYVTISRAAVAIGALRSVLLTEAKKAGDSGPVAEFITALKSQIDDRFYEWTDPEILAMLLDPAVKDTCLKNEEKEDGWKKLEAAYKTMVTPPVSQSSSSSSTDSKSSADGKETKETKNEFKEEHRTNMGMELDQSMIAMSDAQLLAVFGPPLGTDALTPQYNDEVERYRKLSLMDRKYSPLAFWKTREVEFPILAKLARKYLCMQASSAAIERVFSTGGNTVTKKRASLAKDTIEELILLHDNRDLAKMLIS